MDFLDKLRSVEFYSGSKSESNRVSVSEVASGNLLQSYLMRTKNYSKVEKLSQATIGNLADIGLRSLAIDGSLGDSIHSGVRVLKVLSNGTTLSGECDLIDHENKIIYDLKITKMFAYTQIKKEGDSHHYAIQLNYYRLLYGQDYRMVLVLGLKDQSDVETSKSFMEEAFVLHEVKAIDDNVLKQKALSFSNSLSEMINGNIEVPDKCDDTWGNDMKCKYYCEVKSVCKYAKNRGYASAITSDWAK
jgi:hypothetical protein